MEVADATNMLIQMVREIEVDDFRRFAAPVYGKGFIKLFAKAVGLDPAPLIAEFIASQNEAAKAPRSTTPKTANKPAPPPKPPQTESTATEPDEEAVDTEDVPAPDPRAKRLKASNVTMPRADSPFAPANRPPPRQPVASRPPAEHADKKQPLEAHLQETPRETQSFALESDTVASDAPPQPVEKSQEPFQYPTRARPATSADVSTDHVDTKHKTMRPPKPERRQRVTPAMLAQGVAQLKSAFFAFRERMKAAIAMDNDEDSRIRNRYAMTGILVSFTVLAVIIIAASGSGKSTENGNTAASEITAKTNQNIPDEDRPVIVEVKVETLPTEPVQIVRVLPAPKMFAR